MRTEVEALQLEYSWIKEFDPRFNVRYRDDKSYPWLAVTLYEEFPRLQVMRGAKRKGVRYFGPYSHAWAIRETLDLLLRVFPARTCSAGVFKRAGQVGRPCLLGYIGKCSAPCVGRVTADEHRQIVDDFCDFMAGKTDLMMKRLDRRMTEASDNLEFELAARLRDDLEALRRAMEKQAIVFGDGTDADVVAFAEDELEAAVQVFHVRGGRVRGQRGWVVDRMAEMSTGDLVEQFVTQFYGGTDEEGAEIPREVLVPVLPDDSDGAGRVAGRAARVAGEPAGAAARRQAGAGRDGRAATRRSRWCSTSSSGRPTSPPARGRWPSCRTPSICRRRRCASSASTSATSRARTSSRAWSCSRTGWPARASTGGSRCGRAPATPTGSPRSCAAASRRYLDEQVAEGADPEARPGIDPETGRPRKFAYPPNLLVVDGGAPQVAAAQAVLEELGIDDVALVGLAKRLEEVWLPDQDYPAILPRTSEALYLLQRVRDEAHRFAITYHRQKRSKAMTASALDGIAGPGRDAAQGAHAPVRLAEAAARGRRGRTRRGARHRPQDRGGDRRCARRTRARRAKL